METNGSPREVRLEVVGVAQTKGSARAFVPKSWAAKALAIGKQPRAVITNDNAKSKGWASSISNCAAIELARPHHQGKQFTGPVCVEITFYLPRPKKYQTKKYAGVDVPHVTKPDADKLARCAKDALTKVVYTDDSQVTDLIARKRYVEAGRFPRAEIVVREIGPTPTGLFSSERRV